MNRIIVAIKRMQKQIAGRLEGKLVTQEKLEALGGTLDMGFFEYARFQELKSLAVASGNLSHEEGMTIYALLGETPETFNAQPVHVKSVLTSLFGELLQQRATA